MTTEDLKIGTNFFHNGIEYQVLRILNDTIFIAKNVDITYPEPNQIQLNINTDKKDIQWL